MVYDHINGRHSFSHTDSLSVFYMPGNGTHSMAPEFNYFYQTVFPRTAFLGDDAGTVLYFRRPSVTFNNWVRLETRMAH